MYSDWLKLYYSSTDKIQNKTIEKKIVDNKLNISGNNPSKWSVSLESGFFMTLIEYENKLNNNLILAKNTIHDSFKNYDKKMFEKGKKLYNNTLEEIKKLNNFKEKNTNEIKNLDTKIYEEQKNIYLSENMKLIKKYVKHDKDLRKIYSDKKILINKIINDKNMYFIEKENIIKKGPVPDI